MLRPVSRPRRPTARVAVALLALICGVFVSVHIAATGQLPLIHRENVWSIAVCESDAPFRPGPVSPVLTARDVTDVRALFVADPFMIRRHDNWYMFFEVLNRQAGHGDIGLAVSHDRKEWRYQQIVLDEPFHLSYPHVFKSDGEIYMVPESQAAGEIRLYKATDFPLRWQFAKTLLRRDDLVDPTVFRWQDGWWMFAGRGYAHDQLLLFFADDLRGPWVEHPASPVIRDNPLGARPGGKVVRLDNRLYRFGQDCRVRYGRELYAFEIIRLTRSDYQERLLTANPLLRPRRPSTWNDSGMHHFDLHSVQDQWVAAVDGHTKTWVFRAVAF